jgi:hypothetical protein
MQGVGGVESTEKRVRGGRESKQEGQELQAHGQRQGLRRTMPGSRVIVKVTARSVEGSNTQ